MTLNEVTISRAILEEQHRVLINYPEMDAAVVVGGPSGLACAALLGERGVRCALIEKKLSTGGGMWGDGRVGGLVINWTPVDMAGLHVGPLTVACTCTVDASGHDAVVARMVEQKGGRITVKGESFMWADRAESRILDHTREVFPGLFVTGMAANAVAGECRMGPIFGGMLLSGERAAELVLGRLGR